MVKNVHLQSVNACLLQLGKESNKKNPKYVTP